MSLSDRKLHIHLLGSFRTIKSVKLPHAKNVIYFIIIVAVLTISVANKQAPSCDFLLPQTKALGDFSAAHQTMNDDDIRTLYSEVVAKITDQLYLNKFQNISKFLHHSDGKRWSWEGKAYPRIPALLDFLEWVNKYSLQNPKHLLTTAPEDPELEFLFPDRTTAYVHGDLNTENQGDLHIFPTQLARDFDFVVFSQTLEHLYDPILALRNIYMLMKAGGYIFTSAPTTNKPHMTPFHFFHYTPMGLAVLFKRAGFQVVEVGAWGNVDYEKQLTKGKWIDYRQLMGETGMIQNQANTNPDDTWLLARKPTEYS